MCSNGVECIHEFLGHYWAGKSLEEISGPYESFAVVFEDGVQSLNGTLFVDAKDCSIDWRLQIQADDVSSLGFKLRVCTGHVAPESIGLNPGASPNPSHFPFR
jgi:hypothetical protein